MQVLVVEDDRDLRRFWCKALREEGYGAVESESGDHALDRALDYGSHVALYPRFQAFFRTRHPPTLIVWGRNDVIFPAEGARAYLRDLPHAEVHLLDTGHFALEDKGHEIAELMHAFLDRVLPPG